MMDENNSALFNFLFEDDHLCTPMCEVLHKKENLMGGISLTNGNGNTIVETMPSAAGGETVMYGNDETAHLTENMYGSTTLDFTGTTEDIVGRQGIFGEENFYQNGELIGTMKPNFTGDGVDFTSTTGHSFSTSPDIFGDTQVAFSNPVIDSSSPMSSFDLQNSFSEVEAISSQVSVAELGSATDAVDGLDFLGMF